MFKKVPIKNGGSIYCWKILKVNIIPKKYLACFSVGGVYKVKYDDIDDEDDDEDFIFDEDDDEEEEELEITEDW